MRAAIDRVMQTYGMMVNLTPGQEAEAQRRRRAQLAVEGLKYLLGHVPKRRRHSAHLSTASSSCCGS
jgi:hypothetical protein